MEKLEQIILEGESEKVEFKTAFSKEAIESIAAFANTNGGYLFIGIKDDRKVAGIENINSEVIKNWH